MAQCLEQITWYNKTMTPTLAADLFLSTCERGNVKNPTTAAFVFTQLAQMANVVKIQDAAVLIERVGAKDAAMMDLVPFVARLQLNTAAFEVDLNAVVEKSQP